MLLTVVVLQKSFQPFFPFTILSQMQHLALPLVVLDHAPCAINSIQHPVGALTKCLVHVVVDFYGSHGCVYI